MTRGFLGPEFGVWPPGAPVFNKTDSTLALYLDPVGGDDSKVGTSRVNAVLTPERIADLIALYPGNVDVHMRSGAAVLPERGWFLKPRLFGGLLRFIADEAWDPAVFTVIGGDRTAAAATSATVVKAAGLVVNALQDLSIRFTTGDAAGQYRRVRNNTATDIVPTAAWSPAPAAGDTYQIFTSNVAFQIPDVAVEPLYNYVFAADSLALQPGSIDGSVYEGLAMFAEPAGILFDGVGLQGGAGAYQYYFGANAVFFYGTDGLLNYQSVFQVIGGNRCTMFSGYGPAAYNAKEGWGYSGVVAPTPENALIAGTLCCLSGITNYSTAQAFLLGGHYGSVNSFGPALMQLASDSSGTVAPLIDNSGAVAFAIRVSQNANLFVNDGSIDGAILVELGGYLECDGAVSGTGPVEVRYGGRFNGRGVQNIGGGGNDWTVFGLPPFNKSFFALVGDVKLGTDGSAAQRVS